VSAVVAIVSIGLVCDTWKFNTVKRLG